MSCRTLILFLSLMTIVILAFGSEKGRVLKRQYHTKNKLITRRKVVQPCFYAFSMCIFKWSGCASWLVSLIKKTHLVCQVYRSPRAKLIVSYSPIFHVYVAGVKDYDQLTHASCMVLNTSNHALCQHSRRSSQQLESVSAGLSELATPTRFTRVYTFAWTWL